MMMVVVLVDLQKKHPERTGKKTHRRRLRARHLHIRLLKRLARPLRHGGGGGAAAEAGEREGGGGGQCFVSFCVRLVVVEQ
jgi:hypothetical protein